MLFCSHIDGLIDPEQTTSISVSKSKPNKKPAIGRRQAERERLPIASFCLAYSPTLKMEAVRYSEESVDFHRTIRNYNPEDTSLVLLLPEPSSLQN
jgi:hypothetical protein